MALPNTNISVAMVKAELGAATNDVGQLCIHPNINKWSKWKPVRHNSITPITEAQLQSTNYGIVLPTPSSDIIEASSKDYTYNKPRGGAFNEPYRLEDFRNYNHKGGAPAKGAGDILIYTATSSNFNIGIPFNLSGSDELIGIEELNTIKDCYFGMAILQFGSTVEYWRTSADKIKDGGGYVNWRSTEPPFTSGIPMGEPYIFFASTEKYAFGDTEPVSTFYPLPFLTPEESTGTIVIRSGVGQVSWIANKISNFPATGYVDVSDYLFVLGGNNQYFSIQPGSGTGGFYIEFTVTNGGSNAVQYVVTDFRSSLTPTFANTSDDSTGFDVMIVYRRDDSTITPITTSFTVAAGSSANIIIGNPTWLGRLNGISYTVVPNLFKQVIGQLNYNNAKIGSTPIINIRS